ncbi:MAG: hypothetical protein MJ072_01750, partial [Clostridia bacterium]|nr:hypothetical protein [Clostridia bacterium]
SDITVSNDVNIIFTENGLIKYNGFKINEQDGGKLTVYYTEMDERIEDVDGYSMIDNGAYVFEINDDNKEDVFAKYLPLGISNLPLWFIFTDDVEIEDGLYIYGDVNFVFEDGIEVYFNNVNYIGDASLSIYGISTDFYDTARIYFNSVSQGDCELSVYGGIVSVTSSGSYLLGKRLSVYGGLFIAENTGNGNIFSSFPTGSTLNFGEDVGVYVPFNRFAPKDKNAFIKNQINSGKLIFTTEDGISFYIEDSGIENWFTSYDIDGNRYTSWLEDGGNVYYDIDYEVPFGTEWETCWLVVEDELYFSDCVRFARFATINVLLKDWSSLYFDYGICGDMGFTLNIFAQSSDPDDMGYMDVYSDACAIDCSFNDFYVNVYGGNVTIESDSSALALRRYTENYLSIYGGIVTLSSYGDVGTLGSNGLFGVGYHLFIKEGLPVFMEDENRFVESGEFDSIGYHPGTLIIGDYDVKKNPRKPENTDFLIPYITFDEDGNPKTEYVNKYAQDVFYLSNDSKCSVFSEYTESGYFQDLSAIWVIVEGNCSYPSYINLDYEVNVILRENSSLSFNKLYLRPQFGVGVLKVYSETLDYGKMGTLTMGNVLEHYYTNDEERIEVYGGIVKIGQTYSDSFYSTVQEPIYVYGGLVEISDIYNSNIYNIEKRASLLSGNANLILGKDINVYKDESFIKTTVENRLENGWKDNRITLCSESAIEWYKSTVPGILYICYDDNNAPQKAWLMSTNGWLIVEGDMEITERYTGAKNILLKNMSSIV